MKAADLAEKENFGFEDLVSIMALLRAEGGCPWDREQTHKSIRSNFIEEVYEAVEGIDKDDDEIMREELGDVLLQVVFHAQMGAEDGAYTINDIITGICAKLIRRHPHIFGSTEVKDSQQVLSNWNAIKMGEKGQKNTHEAIDGISRSLPSLMRGEKIASKLRKRGVAPATPSEIAKKAADADNAEKVGKLLYALTSYCDAAGIDCEKALYDECERVIKETEESRIST